jgi:hypothetical protein
MDLEAQALRGLSLPKAGLLRQPFLDLPAALHSRAVKDAMRRLSGDAAGVIPDRLSASGIRQPFRKG